MIAKRTTVRCRCNRKVCQHRHNLPKHPDEYVRPRALRCHLCGKGRYRPDPYRTAGKEYRKPCRCGEYSFPHAKGRGACIHNPHFTAADAERRHNEGAYA